MQNTAEPQTPLEGDALVEEAVALLGDDNVREALDTCQAALRAGPMSAYSASRIVKMLRMTGNDPAADQVEAVLRERSEAAIAADPDDAQNYADWGAVLDFLGHPEEAEATLVKCIERAPVPEGPAFMITMHRLARGAVDEAAAPWPELLKNTRRPGPKVIVLARLFDKYGHRDRAEAMLEDARRHFPDGSGDIDKALANLRGTATGADQHRSAVEIFDQFAEDYDENLAAIANRGPQLIAATLEELGLNQDHSRRVLDAGCGTGLCGEFLRLYAKELHGVDLSVKMLEQAMRKDLFHYLARTDLSRLETYPEGRFDLVVCADVFVYFGDLRETLTNLHAKMTPGAWLVFTVERAPDDLGGAGFAPTASGRYWHSDGYLRQVLKRVGFPAPKVMSHATLRHEFRAPVAGTTVAVQKPALAFG
ncbi:methyltransferase domain-containing protein [Rhodobacteraceae bacterium CCMM004]|nr:methyltransferase domain-containing protein [Rhodobacteraceae bacterium CCMM004]